MAAALDAKLAAKGEPPSEGPEAYANRIFLELDLEETYEKEGYPDGVEADPACGLNAVFGVEARSMEHAIQATEAKVKGEYAHEVAFILRPSHSYGSDPNAIPGRWGADDPRLRDPCAGLGPLSSFAPLARALGLASEVADRSREVGTRRYLAYCPVDSVEERAVVEAGQALALMDGGLPGAEATTALGTFFGGVAALNLSSRTSDLNAVIDGLDVHGHTSEANAYELHHGHVYLDSRDGSDALMVHDDNGDLVLDRFKEGDGAASGYRVARHEEGQAEVTLARLRAGDESFPGYLGAFSAVGERVACVREPPFTTRAIRDFSLIECVLAEAACTLEDAYSTACRTP